MDMYKVSSRNKAHTIWFTGLPSAGKTVLANGLTDTHIILDGDVVRHGLNSDIGFTNEGRKEQQRRLMELATLLNRQGLNVVVASICPFEADRGMARVIIDRCYIVYCKCSTEISDERSMKKDPDSFYKKLGSKEEGKGTRAAKIFEDPKHVDLLLDTENKGPKECMIELAEFVGAKLYK